MSDAIDAQRYRRLRQNWIDCDELGLHGRTVVIDSRLDKLLNAAPQVRLGDTRPSDQALHKAEVGRSVPAVAAPYEWPATYGYD